MFKLFLPVLLMLFILTGVASADFYKWEDEEGTLHITDYPPPTKTVKKINVHKTDSNADMTISRTPQMTYPPPSTPGPSYDTKPGTTSKVILYTTSWCPYCKKAKAYFESRGIPYTEYDIEKDREAAIRKRQLGGNGVPFAIINGKHISGYSPDAYNSALGKNK